MKAWAIWMASAMMALAPSLAADPFLDRVPNEAKPELVEFFNRIPFDEARLKKLPYAKFTSDVIMPVTGHNIVSRLHFFENKRFDVWLLRANRGDLADNARDEYGHWVSVAIVVDKKTAPKRAYFLEFQRADVKKGSPPQIAPISLGCFECHPNGPRAIRPIASRWIPKQSEKQQRLIKKWNERIAQYRYVEAVLTEEQKAKFIEDKREWDPLQHSACTECHNNSREVRAPLLRMHRDAILSLAQHTQGPGGFAVPVGKRPHAFMPPALAKLDARELKCLQDWLKYQAPKADCSTPLAGPLVLDPFASDVEARAASPVGNIDVRGFLLAGAGRCEPDCHLELRIDLRGLTTGIRLRDRHLREKLGETATVRLAGGAALVELRGTKVSYPAPLTCRPEPDGTRCRLEEVTLDLRKHGIVPPAFLGAEVDPLVKVAGEAFLRPKPTRQLASPRY